MQDSVIINCHFSYEDVKIIQYMSCSYVDGFFRQHRNYNNIEKVLGYKIPQLYHGVAFNSFFCSKYFMDKLVPIIEQFIPNNKYESHVTECLLGIIFSGFGVDLTTKTIQGLHYGNGTQYVYDNSILEKLIFGRK